MPSRRSRQRRPGDRVKTDPRDARKLARLHAGGLLEAITVPNEQVEALRDLVRAREDARIDRMRDRHRMSKFLPRHGLRMPNKSWGVTRRAWLGSLTFPCPGTVAGGRVRSIAVRPTGGSTCSST